MVDRCSDCGGDHSIAGEVLDAIDRIQPETPEEVIELERIKNCIRIGKKAR